MPSESLVILANLSRKNLPHIATDLAILEPKPLLNGLFKFLDKPQAINTPASTKYHQIQTITSVQTSAFQSSNNFFDFNLPMNIDVIDEEILLLTLLNTHASSSWISDAPASFFLQRCEIRLDNLILQTIRDIQLYMENTIYLDDFDRGKQEPMNAIDRTTYKVNTTAGTIAAGSTATFRLKLNTFLSKCNVFLKGVRGQIVFRFYPQSVGVFSASAQNGNLQLQSTMLLLREQELTPDARNKMNQIYRSNVDFRYIDAIHEQTVLSLVNNSTTKYVTNNFHDTVYSHLIVLTRASVITTGLTEFSQHNNVYLEDVSSMNLSNGIQWTDADLRLVVYQSHFPNDMTQQADMNVYVPLCASSSPEKAYKNGVENGWSVLPRNAKVCINPSSTFSGTVDILCYAYTHCRIENGKINIY